MKKFFKYPEIKQFRSIIRDVHQLELNHKTLTFHGTVKLHGSNGGVILDNATGDIYCQSKNRTLTVEDDNHGFCKFVQEKKENFRKIFFTSSDKKF